MRKRRSGEVKMKYKRVLLKLSGEALGEDNFAGARVVAAELKQLHNAGLEIAVVNGGGNIIRGRDVETLGLERTQADYMGMLGTVINALALQDVLKKQGMDAVIQSAVNMPPIANLYSRDVALNALNSNKIVIFAAGTGHPFFSTDTTAALRAAEINADCVVKGTNVDGIYDSNPKVNKNAKFLPELTYTDALKNNINVMDSAAFSLCRDNKIPVLVLNMQKAGNLADLLIHDKKIGSVVHE